MGLDSNWVISFINLQYLLGCLLSDNHSVDTQNGTQPVKQKDDTVRVDPLNHLRKYRGGYEIRDLHYWSVRLNFSFDCVCVSVPRIVIFIFCNHLVQSTVYTGVPGYALGVLWLLCGISYGLYLLVTKFCFKCYDKRRLRKRSLYTSQYYIWPVLLAVIFTILAM